MTVASESESAAARVVRGSLARLVGYASTSVVLLLTTPLVVRHLGSTEYGKLATTMSLAGIAISFVDGGLATVAIDDFAAAAGDPRRRRAIANGLLGLRLVLGLAFSLVILAYAILAGYSHDLVIGAGAAGVVATTTTLAHAATVPLLGTMQLNKVAIGETVRGVVYGLAQIVLVAAGAGFVPLALAAAVGSVAALGVALVQGRRFLALRALVNLSEWNRLARATALFAGATALGYIYFQMSLQATQALTTPRTTGQYAIPFRVVEFAASVAWILGGSVYAALVRTKREDPVAFAAALRRTTTTLLVVGGTLSVTLGLAAPTALRVVAGEVDPVSVDALRILAPVVFLQFLMATWSLALLALGSERALLGANALAFSVAVAAALVLIPSYGAPGAAAASVITEVTIVTLYGLALSRAPLAGSPIANRRALSVVGLAVATSGIGAAALAAGLPNLLGAGLAVVVLLGANAAAGNLSEAIALLRGTDRAGPSPQA